MIALVLIYLIDCQNKEEKYIAFLMENYHQNLNRNISNRNIYILLYICTTYILYSTPYILPIYTVLKNVLKFILMYLVLSTKLFPKSI